MISKKGQPPPEPRRFNFKTLVGNWNEDLYRHEHKSQASLNKFANNDALLQHTESMLDFYLNRVQLQSICEYIQYGSVIQLCAPDFANPFPKYEGLPMVVSVYLHSHLFRKYQQFSEECNVSVAPSIQPCRRNSFIIRSSGLEDKTGQHLCYGDSFNIQLVEPDPNGIPLVLYSSLKSQNLQFNRNCPNNYYKNSEINQSIGLCARMDLSNEKEKCLQTIPPLHTFWKCFHIQPNMRYETEGDPVPSNQRLVISHSASNKMIAAENTQSHTVFGNECGISVATYESVHRIQREQNVWMLKTA